MSFQALRQRLSLPIFITALLLLAGGLRSFAQSRLNTDSAARARQQTLEATRAAQKRTLDSAKASRQHMLDSLKASRLHRTDSLQAIRKYRESRRFRDSVTEARQDRVETIREAQHARLDSMKDARQRITDSIVASREAQMAPIRKAQKTRMDSLNALKKYKTSKRYADSVAIAQKARAQELAAKRKTFTDSLTAARKANMDQLKAARKVITDSLAASRKLRTDSLAAKRKEREAKLAKNKDNQVRDKKLKEKQAENKAQLAFELKIKKKRSVYSNENMLKKKWSAPRKGVQNTFTHYNYYFNAARKMDEAEANMQRAAKDKWDERIELFSFNPTTDSATFTADMDSVIQKASLGIQIHDPRTKWADDLYLLLGKAYFYKGDMENAAASFKYIVALNERAKAEAAKKTAYSNSAARGKSKEAPSFVTPEQTGLAAVIKREPANNKGLLWLAHTYTTYGRNGDAESILDLLGADPKLPESLRGELALEKGFLALKEHNDKEASAELMIASADKSIPVYTRRRAAFVAGQLYQEAGAYNEAAKQFAIVTDLHPKIDMDFAARRNRAYALMQSGGVQKDAIASLKSMLGDGKFSPYYEQIYYVLGRLSANAGNTDEAASYLKQGLASSKTTRKQRALSFAALGNIYFAGGAYPQAKLAYDSVSRFASAAPDDSGVAIAMRRAPLVDKIAVPSRIIHQQDSLLALGALSEKEQRAIVRRYIRALQARKADSAFQAENGGLAAAAVKDNSELTGDAGTSQWYFANPAQMQQGITEFKRKWGTRPQADNWRRSAALAASGAGSPANSLANGNNTSNGTTDDLPADGALDENGIPTEEALLAVIPATPEARAVATGRLQRAMVDMSTAYLKQFEDYTRTVTTLDSFDKRWSLNPYTAEATYLRYLVSLRKNNLKDAQKYSDRLQKDFGGTQWASYVAPAPGDKEDSGPALASVGEYYDATYDLLQQRQYGEVLSRTRSARRQYPDEAYSSRFRIVEAMAYAGSAQYNEADTILNDFIRNNNSDPLKPWAEQVLSYVTARRKVDTLKPAAGNLPAAALPANIMAPGTGAAAPAAGAPTIGQPPTDTSSLPVPAEYAHKPSEPHYFIFAVNKVEQKTMGVKAGIADLNTFRYSMANLSSEVVAMKAGKGIIAVKTFKNMAAARTYLAAFNDAKMLVREYNANEYQTFIISAPNYRKLVHDGSIGSYLPFYRAHY